MSDSTTMTSPTEQLVGQIQMTGKLFATDLSHMTEEMLGKPVCGKARCAYDLIYEVAFVNRLAADGARGTIEKIEEPEGWITAPPEFKNKDRAIQEFQASVDEVTSALRTANEEALQTKVPTPLGLMPLLDFAQILPSHIMYHSGQLNFIQTCYGDDQFHWA